MKMNKWMKIEATILNEKTNAQNNKYPMFSLIC